MSSAPEEIELLERVLFRLGTADSDEKLEAAVGKFLTPVLLKIASPHENVRCKVMEVLTHVNKRLKSRPAVQFPVEALLDQYISINNGFHHNFSIIYIKLGFPRLTLEKQTEIAPKLMNSIEGKPEDQQDQLLMLVLPLLGEIKIPIDVEEKKKVLQLEEKPKTKNLLLELLQDVLLLPYGITQEAAVPPGLSTYSFKRIIANHWKAEELEQLKKGIARFICSGIFADKDIFILLVLASADTRFSVATPAIAELSKVSTSIDFDDPQITAPLYTLFSGNQSKIPDRKTTPSSARVRQKLLQYLIKSRGKGINTIKGIQVIFEGLFGENTNQKCKVLALQFCENLIKDGPKEIVTKVSKVILSGISKLLGKDSEEAIEVQNAAYTAMAQLARTCPEIFNQDLKIVVSYFNHLASAPPDLHTALREALVSIAPAFAWDYDRMDTDNTEAGTSFQFVLTSQHNLLLAMLSDNAESKLQIVQNVTSVFLTACFPEHYAPARYLLLLIAGERSSLRETVTTSLYGASKKDNINYTQLQSNDHVEKDKAPVNSKEQRKILLPSFKAMMNHIAEMSKKRLATSAQKFLVGKTVLPFHPNVYAEILDYLRICFWFSAGAKTQPGDEKYSKVLQKYILSNYEDSSENEIHKYLNFVKLSVEAKRDETNLTCLHDLLNAAPALLTKKQLNLLESLAASLKDISEAIRSEVSKIYGILLGYGLDDNDFNKEINEILNTFNQKSLENKHGLILVLGQAFHWRILSYKSTNIVKDFSKWTELNKAVTLIATLLSDQHALQISAAVKSLSLIGKVTELPSIDIQIVKKSQGQEEKMQVDEDEVCLTTKDVIFEIVFTLLKSTSVRLKIREDSAACLGSLAIGDGKYFTLKNLEKLISMIKLQKDPALNIAIAQAIVCTIAGYDVNLGEESDGTVNPFCDDKTLDWFLDSLIKFVPEPNPNSRQSCVIWLLAIVKNCSKRTPVIAKKQMLQFAFTELLSDDSDFVQDVASRGLGLVFTLSDANSQSELANSLLDQLIGGKRQVNKVTEDTELFHEGVLGKTPTGGNMTTYKELCSLASDVNQPDLIYQFMQLANHNATWNSKLGAAFGLKSISKDAKVKIQPYLGKIVPRLYRYKYDPTPKIHNSMISIWDSIVTDSKETVELYYWDILKEISINLTNTEWRVRIACCLAIKDLLKRPNGLRLRSEEKDQSSTSMDIDNEVQEPELKELWSQLFRVMDDIHEGTRLAAEGSVNFLSKICVVAASNTHGKSGSAVASSILPLILDVGVTHAVPEIQKVSIKTISELIESSGALITPHLPSLIPCLLKATGELETPKLSYLSARLAVETEAQEMLDTARAEAAKSHHTMDTIAKCVRHIDFEALEKMTPTILELIKSSVSLGTKIACAHFICLISIRLDKEMTPLVGKYLGGCFGGLKDRNTTVRKYYASAIGHLIGAAKEQSVKNLFGKLADFYYENPANRGVPLTFQSINKRHHDLVKDYAESALPLIFFAMHEEETEENKSNIELWKDLWAETSPGDAGIRMNLDSIIPQLEKALEDPSWLKKAQCGNAINTIATRLGTNLDEGNRLKLINMMLNMIPGRTYQGKERLLQALASLCKGLNKEDPICVRIIDITLKECRKEEPHYRTQALKSLGDILEELETDRFEEVYDMVWYILDKKDLQSITTDNEDLSNITADERSKRATTFNKLKETVCETLGKSWPKNSADTQSKYQIQFVERCVQCLQDNTRQVQISLLVSLGKFLDRLKIFDEEASENPEKKQKVDKNTKIQTLEKIVKEVLSAVVYASSLPHTGLKKESLNILLTLIKKLSNKENETHLACVRKMFEENLPIFQKDHAPEVRYRIKDIEDKLRKL